MNKSLLFITVAVLIIQPFVQWWIIIPITAINGWFSKNKKSAIISGSGGVSIAWGILYLYKYFSGGIILTARIAELMQLHNSIILFVVTVSFAAIFSVLGSLCGYYFWQLRNQI